MMHFVADDGQSIRVQVTGNGPPLVMLHGWTASHEEWQMFVKALAAHHRLFLWDARGHGDPVLPTETPATLQRMARDVHQMLEYFALTDVTLVGHSMGALTAWEYIRQFGTGKLTRLCVIDQSPKLLTDSNWACGIYGAFNAERAARFLQALRNDFIETVLQLSAHGLNARARQTYDQDTRGWQRERVRLAKLMPAPLTEIWESLTQADLRDVLPKVTIPSLVIHGAESNFYPLQTAEFLRAHLPDAVLHIYDNTDHCPHLWQPTRFVRDLLAFAKADAV